MTLNRAIHVALYTDQSLLVEGLAAAFASRPEFRLAASLKSIEETLAFARKRPVDILLLDVTDELTVTTLQSIRRANPNCRMVLLAGALNREFVYQAVEAGVRGILPKSLASPEVLSALEALHEGELWFEKDTLETLIANKPVTLTYREGQLVNLLSQGLKNKEIAWTLRISEGTVKVYLSRLFKKLGVNDRFELALYGLKNLQFGYSGQAENRLVPGVSGEPEPPTIRSILIHGRDGRARTAEPQFAT